MEQIKLIATLENDLNNLQRGKIEQAEAIKIFRDGLCQLAELQPFLEKGCWDNTSSKLLMQSDDQILDLIFDQSTPPDKINDLLYKIKAQLEKRGTRRVKRIQISENKPLESSESSESENSNGNIISLPEGDSGPKISTPQI